MPPWVRMLPECATCTRGLAVGVPVGAVVDGLADGVGVVGAVEVGGAVAKIRVSKASIL